MNGLPIRTERLDIRDFSLADLPAVHALVSDAEVARFTSFDSKSVEQSEAMLRDWLPGDGEREHYKLAALSRGSDELVGWAGSMARDEEQFEIGYAVTRAAWGQGLATEIAQAMTAFSFDARRAHRVFARVDPRNPASARVLEKLGFRREAHFRLDSKLKGEWCDTVVFGMLSSEWRLREA